MALSKKIKEDTSKKRKEKLNNIEFFKEQILITDALKEDYDKAIKKIDKDLLSDIDTVNKTLRKVRSAYEDRIDSGCRTDLFWRFTGFDVSTSNYNLVVTRLSVTGYGTTLEFVESSGGITTYFSDNLGPGIEVDYLHGIKYYTQPYIKDIGDTTLGSFIGIVGAASTILTIVSQSASELKSNFSVGNLIISSKTGVFPSGSNKIVGFGSTTITGISTTIMEDVVGIATTSLFTSTILLETPTVASASLPETDGSYVDFTVVTDPDTFEEDNTRFKYGVKFSKNPFSPEKIGIMTSGDRGAGISIKYDNSGNPSSTQSWKPEYEGTEKDGEKVKEPKVGAGKIYNIIGFTSEPTILGVPQPEGTSISVPGPLTGLYTVITPPSGCTSIETDLTNAISARDAAETSISVGSTCISKKINAANALREERSQYSLRIWGLRQSIGAEGEGIDKYDALDSYINDTEDTIDSPDTTSCL